MTKQLKKPPIFATRKAEAEFWDTHDVTEFSMSAEPLPIKYQLQPSQGITVRFRQDDLALLRKLANHKRIGVTTLIRMVMLEYAQKILTK